MLRPVDLRCEYRDNPLGIDVRGPRFSWRLEGDGERQEAYRAICRAQPGGACLWDSGKVPSGATTHIEYDGKPLESSQRVFWSVTSWDDLGGQSEAEEQAWFETGLLAWHDWKARWIALPPAGDFGRPQPCQMLRHEFTIRSGLLRARLYATARGLYRAWINGRMAGRDCLTPGWTDYHRRQPYQTYDVTDLLYEGPAAIGLALADGWYCGAVGFGGRNHYGPFPMGLAQILLEYEGGVEWVLTGDGWTGATGPWLCADLLHGETYDARLEPGPWTEAGFDAGLWRPVASMQAGTVPFAASAAEPVRAVEELAPVARLSPARGRWVFDMGQNLAGWVRLTTKGRAGEEAALRFAEVLSEDGAPYRLNYRAAEATDRYVRRGGEPETFEPAFTYRGFRYVEVDGLSSPQELDDVRAIAAHTPLRQTGLFTCSNPMVNQLVNAIRWTMRCNFVEVPTDCPQRDERLGWMGDAQAFAGTASYLYDVAAFFTKWLQDVLDAQTPDGAFPNVAPNQMRIGEGAPAWADAGVIVPWTVYRFTGDARLLRRHYDSMARFVEMVRTANPDLIWRHRSGPNYADWLNVDDPTPPDLVGTAFFANSARLAGRSARALGLIEEEQRHERLFWRIRHAFQEAFLGPEGALECQSQTAQAVALRFDLLPTALRPLAVDRLVQSILGRGTTLSTGFVGVAHLLPALSENGHLDLAYELLLQTRYPSWGFMVEQGATTIWERWDGFHPEKGFQDPSMNSFNHFALGSCGEWLFATVAGIGLDPKVPGFRRFVLAPQPGPGLDHAEGSYLSLHGLIESAWRTGGGETEYRFMVPPNTTAIAKLRGQAASLPSRAEELPSPTGQTHLLLAPGSYTILARER
jgi:alpha-L-rhamnosidase